MATNPIHKMDNEKSVWLDREEHSHRGNIGGKRVVIYYYNPADDTLLPVNSTNKLPVEATFGGTVESAPTFKLNPADNLEESKYAKVDSDYHVQADILSSALPSGAATSANQDTTNTRLGEVQATPTANTVLGRLKDLQTELDQKPDSQTVDLDLGAGTANRESTGLLLANFGTPLPAADNAAYGDDMASGILPAGLRLFNGASYTRARGDVSNGLDVDVTRSVLPTGAATEATLTEVRDYLDTVETKLQSIGDQSSRFKRVLKAEPNAGEEMRIDTTLTDNYHGMATDATAETTASWDVVRFYKDAGGNITRIRYRTGVAWSARSSGW